MSVDNGEVLKRYFENYSVRKLHLGSGGNIKDDWLNTDIAQHREGIFLMDLTKDFPFEAEIFDYAYSEHSIEHFSYEAGLSMLGETLRVLKPGGVIRVATPSIGFLINLFSNDRTSLEDAYIAFQSRSQRFPRSFPGFVFNSFVRSWGHTFIYDRQTLRLALEVSGFVDIRECDILESSHESLRNLENVKRMPSGYLELESMILEATKPRPLV